MTRWNRRIRWFQRLTRGVSLVLMVLPAIAVAQSESQMAQSLDKEVQSLKDELISLNRDLFLLEEELLFPSSTQVAVFISMDVGEFFALDSVKIELNGKEVAHYLYTEREVDALHRGGIHKIYLGNLKTGEHELSAFFVGKGPSGRDYLRGADLRFEKDLGVKYLELKIDDSVTKRQPEFVVKEW
ncbi:MAG: AraC family transcriptional regulator [Gammaproteobacteria bacterium]|nr:AraC family transcriptional regulator [Gammaproteobacteria bacterium]